MNWGLYALVVSAALLIVWSVQVFRKRPPIVALAVSLALLLVAAMNSAAPIRGLLDPGYMGYAFGLLKAKMGPAVTVVAGSVFISAVAAGLIAASVRRGPLLWIVSATCAAFSIVMGAPWLADAVTDPSGNVIQFGEYLTIPGLVATILLLTLLCVPFAVGTVWAARAARR